MSASVEERIAFLAEPPATSDVKAERWMAGAHAVMRDVAAQAIGEEAVAGPRLIDLICIYCGHHEKEVPFEDGPAKLLAHHDACEKSPNAELRRVTAVRDMNEQDAERWRALVACARVRVLGHAGITPGSKFAPFDHPYAHIGVELWTMHSSPPEDSEGSRRDLTAFADKARALNIPGGKPC